MLSGIDVSHHQNPAGINWDTVAASQAFMFARSSYGTQPDRYFDEHYAGAREAGLRCGAYHFFRPGQSAMTQMDVFCRQLDLMKPDGIALPPALDVEANEKYDGVMNHERYAAAVTWCVEALLNRYGSMFLYVTQRDWRSIGNPDCITLPGVMIWVAHYTKAAKPATPMGRPWTFWQHSGTGRVKGCGDQDIDINRFDGTLQQLPTIGTTGTAEPSDGVDSDRVIDLVGLTLDQQKRDFFEDHDTDPAELKPEEPDDVA